MAIDGTQHYQSLGEHEEFSVAKEKGERWLSQVTKGAHRAPSRGTVRDALSSYIRHLRSICRRSTAWDAGQRFRLTAGHTSAFGRVKLQDARREDFEAWRNGLRKGRQPRSVNRQVRAVVVGLNFVLASTGYCYSITAAETTAGFTTATLNTDYVYYDARRYLIDMTGATDSTTAMNMAHSMGVPIHYPAGSVKFTHITMACGGILGDGMWTTSFSSTDLSTANTITVNGNSTNNCSPTFSNFNLTYTGTKTGGYAFMMQPTSGTAQIEGTRFLSVLTQNSYSSVYFAQSFGFGIVASEFSGCINTCIYVANTVNGDNGDSSIVGGVISGQSGATGIHYVSSGGLKITGVKFLGGAYGILLDWNSTTNSSDLIISGSSIEGQSTAGIAAQRQAGNTTTFGNLVVTGTEFEPLTGSYAFYTDDTSGFLHQVVFSNNVVGGDSSSYGIYVDYVTNGSFFGNAMAAGGGGVAITLGTHNTGVNLDIADNQVQANSYGTISSGVFIPIASLPVCNSGNNVGMRQVINNGIASPTYLQTVSTTGSSTRKVFCDGSGSWLYE